MTRHILNPHLVHSVFNQLVKTPLGEGRAFGVFHLKDANRESVGQRVVVRLPVDDVTRPHLKAENCLTQKAETTAVFTFDINDVEV